MPDQMSLLMMVTKSYAERDLHEKDLNSLTLTAYTKIEE